MEKESCNRCHRLISNSTNCSKCNVSYCGRVCQRTDYPEHKKVCGTNKEICEVFCKWKCDNCGSLIEEPLLCIKCKSAPYCNKKCLKAHWKKHIKVCGIDVVTLSNEEMQKLSSELIKNIKSNKLLADEISSKCYCNMGKQLTVLSVVRNRSINEFQNLKVSDMSIIEYTKFSNTNMIYDVNNPGIWIVILSERQHIMISGFIPVTELV
jgi:hypothetical protein